MNSQREWVEVGREGRQCQKHGAFESVLSELRPQPVHPESRAPHRFQAATSCPICNGEMQLEADRRHLEIMGGVSERDRLRAAAFRAAGIPDRFKDCDIWHWQHGMDQQRRVWDAVRDYCTGLAHVVATGQCMVLLGAAGTGKTHLACGIVRHVIEKGGTARYATVLDAIGTIRATYSRGAEQSEQEAMEALCSVDVLALDEVGRQTDTGHEREMLFRILDGRYRNLRPTVLVSNLNRDKLSEFLGPAIVDRTREAGGRWLVLDWASQRNQRPRAAASEEVARV
jgi:DNA replication protein DnaC